MTARFLIAGTLVCAGMGLGLLVCVVVVRQIARMIGAA